MTGRIALYSAVDEDVTHYEVDVESASLARRGTVKAPAHIPYDVDTGTGRTQYWMGIVGLDC